MPKKNRQQTISPAITNFPSPLHAHPPILSEQEKIDLIADRFKDIMEALGLDLNNDSLSRTPQRVAKMYVKEVFSGLNPDKFPPMSFFEHDFDHDHRGNTVFVKVGFTSFCEHHFVPMTGFAYVAYVPKKKLIGLSKIPRIVRFFAKRPQLQERLAAQIADSLSLLLEIEDVAISITANHFCVMARGIQDESSHAITTILRGQFGVDDNLRREFFEGVNRQH